MTAEQGRAGRRRQNERATGGHEGLMGIWREGLGRRGQLTHGAATYFGSNQMVNSVGTNLLPPWSGNEATNLGATLEW